MSDYDDGIELDEDELAELYADNPDTLTPEDVFSMVLLNKKSKKRVWVSLEDDEGDEIELSDMMAELISYVKDKMDDGKENQLVDQIMPLMTQAVVSGLGRLAGLHTTGLILMHPVTRMAIIDMMMVSFILYKMVQVKGLKINTIEEDVDDEEIEEIERKAKAHSVAGMSAMLGMDPKEALQHMVTKGDITEDDLRDLLGDNERDDDETKN